MARPASIHPTELELLILKVLWQQAPRPVREIRDALADAGRELAHTSVITTLNIMVKKKYLRRKRDGNAFQFAPCVEREEVSHRMLGDVVDRVFDGSARAAMLSLLDAADVDRDELQRAAKDHQRQNARSKLHEPARIQCVPLAACECFPTAVPCRTESGLKPEREM